MCGDDKAYFEGMPFAEYYFSNEDITRFIGDIGSEDTVLAILGGVDFSFAAMETAKRVIAIDNCNQQIMLGYFRKQMLENGNIDSFFYTRTNGSHHFTTDFLARRKTYFSNDRLRKIAERLPRLDIREDNIFSLSDTTMEDINPTVVYCSNALTYGRNSTLSEEEKIAGIERIIHKMHSGGIVLSVKKPQHIDPLRQSSLLELIDSCQDYEWQYSKFEIKKI